MRALPLLALLAGCAPAALSGSSSSGQGGAFVVHSVSSPVSAGPSASSGSVGWGWDAGEDASCATCRGALFGEHALGPFCAGSDAFAAWSAYVSCGCAKGGACEVECSAGPWCSGVYPVSKAWVDPIGPCANCLLVAGPSGCADQAALCSKN